MIKAVVFDLDDTLMPETDYVKSGFKAISREFGDPSLMNKLWDLFVIDRKDVYQRAGFSENECKKCIDIYRKHFPDIVLDTDIKRTLEELKSKGIKLGIITDGRPEGQHNKIRALGLDKIMDVIIITDELGGEKFRKPHPKAFELMRDRLGVQFEEMMYVGDNPAKDFYIGSIYPITTVRLHSEGMYGECNYLKDIKEKMLVFELNDIVKVLR